MIRVLLIRKQKTRHGRRRVIRFLVSSFQSPQGIARRDNFAALTFSGEIVFVSTFQMIASVLELLRKYFLVYRKTALLTCVLRGQEHIIGNLEIVGGSLFRFDFWSAAWAECRSQAERAGRGLNPSFAA